MNVYDQAHVLARLLKNHPDVAAMREAQSKVENDPDAKRMYDDFAAKAMKLQLQEMGGMEISQEDRDKLEKLSELVHMHSDIRRYQEYSVRVERLLQDIYKIITSSIQPSDN